ncbi:MAG: hypothetical protein IJW31_00555 [Lentisphaeria bacterium]|nr:hypothetical protein [Lentisphaeria bacterium]
MNSNNFDYIFQRVHRNYFDNYDIWVRSSAAYQGGEQYIRKALIRHVSEIDLEFAERLKRAYYFNYPRKIAQLITQYILSVEPCRRNVDSDLAEDFSRKGLRVNELMRQFSTVLNVYGMATILIEMPYFDGEIDYERKTLERIRPYGRVLSPLNTVDYAYGNDGRLEWLLIEEIDSPEHGPFLPRLEIKRRKLFTRNEIMVFEKIDGKAVLVNRTTHGLNRVPAVMMSEFDTPGIGKNHYFEDVVRISDAILNNESEAQMNLVKQMFGLLVIPENFAGSAVNTGNGENRQFSHVIARSAAICEASDEKGISRYISPSGADTKAIREENIMLKKELFNIVGMNAQNENNILQSAESKSWDYHSVRQFLASRVDMLEQAEIEAWKIMKLYDDNIPIPEVIYNRDFSVIQLESSINALLNLDSLSNSAKYHHEIEKTALFLLEKLKKIPQATKDEILTEMENIKTQKHSLEK